ncbi:MAG: T9SS type A sorting domain-containing protein [Crocinitomicaceae bacterium]|nr:T9SS type A sorting domain-containing protein [Crocinitomicaceae bacterium]
MKQLLLIPAVIFCSTTIAQNYGSEPDAIQANKEPIRAGVTSSERAAPFWEEDFGGGFPSDWVLIDSSGICPWTHSYDGSYGFFSGGGITTGDTPLASTTGSNGFMICDNDSANHFNYGQPSSTNYQYLSSYFGTSAIDCSGHSSVILRFEQAYRFNNSVQLKVLVSTDSTNWTVYNVTGGTSNNTASANPDVEILNISSIAANQSEVFLRFGWSARVYYWMIDDISLAEADPNDVIMTEGFWGMGSEQNQYYKIPLSQNPEFSFYGSLTNNTGTTMNDAYYDVTVDNGSVVFSETSALLDLALGETDTTDAASNWTPTSTDQYDISFDASVTGLTDGNLANNNFSDSIRITSSQYGLDNLPDNGSGYNGVISNWSGETGNPFAIGNIYEILEADELECIEIGISTGATNEGNIIYGAVYYFDFGLSEWTFLEETPDYTITNADLGTVRSISFDQPVSVGAGDILAVLACHYGGTDVQFMMAQGVPTGMVVGFDSNNDWYNLLNPKAIVCRANFACGLGVNEQNTVNNFSVYPNPANDVVTISFELMQAEEISYQIIDAQGKVVYTSAPLYQQAGPVKTHLPVNGFSKGIYTLRVQTGDSFQFQKISIY